MGSTLAIVFVVRVLLYPHMPPIVMGAFKTEYDCMKAGAELDKSTPIRLELTCEVRT